MSITRRMTEMDPNPFGLSAAGHRCFHWGEFLQDPAMLWDGLDGQTIYFHGPCFLDWMPRGMRDALELKYAGHPCQEQVA
ncbi:MAG: hypothetical protein KGS09_18895 [Nitrospirae bacterium]|nr:hypothetical protein [Nitrospirota bacterium]MDE3041571.1 hypothetical protein [Nitrospirota bacterium]MDE3049556.1 hypothetical protein [Nitrospirota bacterium]